MYNLDYVQWLIREINFLIERLIFCHERGTADSELQVGYCGESFDRFTRENLAAMCQVGYGYTGIMLFMTEITTHYDKAVKIYDQLEHAYVVELRYLKDIHSASENYYWNRAGLGHQIYTKLAEHGIELEWLIEEPRRPWEVSKSE